MADVPHLLILGGTGEAKSLAEAASARFGERLQLTSSLAGRTRRPHRLPGEVRVGGFGGSDGLAAYLRAANVTFLIDATHPFAAAISANAGAACGSTAVPRLQLLRPMWRRAPGDIWFEVDDVTAAAGRLQVLLAFRTWPTVLMTQGTGGLAAFRTLADIRFLVRVIDPPDRPLPLEHYEVIPGRGPFTLDRERALLAERAVDAIVCKASGGAATEAKILAAREQGIPVVMLQRPPPEPGEAVQDIDAALDWIAAKLLGIKLATKKIS